jgi:NAD(P)H-flavin reductase
MSNWLSTSAGAPVSIRGPFGECHYVRGEPERPLLLIATGTGLAPLLGILADATRAGHRGDIRLFHGARAAGGLYRFELLRKLAEEHAGLTVVQCAPDDGVTPCWPGVRTQRVEEVVQGEIEDFRPYRVYVCGNPQMVQSIKKRAYLAGVPLERIHADPFVHAPAATPFAKPPEVERNATL